MQTPNLFTYATSELSQDAVLAYILAWANPQFASSEGKMHGVGQAFLRLLAGLHDNINLRTIEKVTVDAQVNNIDVLAYVKADGKAYTFVIEDKIHAGSYNNLPKYLEAAKTKYPQAEPLGIYLRTGSQADYSAIEAVKFRVLDRKAFLDFLRSKECQGAKNAIMREYISHVEGIEAKYQAYSNTPVAQWDGSAWVGFYHNELLPHERLHFGGYQYISNPQGGFQGCWMSNEARRTFEGYPVYLLLEQCRLTFKIGPVEDKEGRTALVRRLNQYILTSLPEGNELGIKKPGRLSPGRHMTGAQVDLCELLKGGGHEQLLGYLQKCQDFYYTIFSDRA